MIICKECGEKKKYFAKGMCSHCYDRKWRHEKYIKNSEHREAKKKKAISYHLKGVWGLTLEDYDEMLESQGGGCAICGKSLEDELRDIGKRLAVDHCHKTGEIRGLLCMSCNLGISKFDDDPELTTKATEYLLSWR